MSAFTVSPEEEVTPWVEAAMVDSKALVSVFWVSGLRWWLWMKSWGGEETWDGTGMGMGIYLDL